MIYLHQWMNLMIHINELTQKLLFFFPQWSKLMIQSVQVDSIHFSRSTEKLYCLHQWFRSTIPINLNVPQSTSINWLKFQWLVRNNEINYLNQFKLTTSMNCFKNSFIKYSKCTWQKCLFVVVVVEMAGPGWKINK